MKKQAKHRFLSLLLAGAMLLSLFPALPTGIKAAAAEGKLSGSGTVADPYLIETAEQLAAYRDIVNNGSSSACGKLTADIKLDSSQPWTPIGKAWNSPFEGTFDGNGHTVSGLNVSGVTDAGLFGYNDGGTIQNVGIIDSTINGYNYAGGVCGYNWVGKIQNCYNTGEVNGSGNNPFVGGVCGSNSSGTIQNCYNTGAVSGSGNVGGVCGYNNYGTIQNCYNTGEVNGSGYNPFVGGVCGYNTGGKIQNCYNTGAVSASGNDSCAGGVCGYNTGGKNQNCYNTGAVSGGTYNGGVCGENYVNSTEITNTYYLEGTADKGIGSGSGSAELKTEEELKNLAPTLGTAYMKDLLNMNNGYPVLVSQLFPQGGTGTVADPYLIANAEQLAAYRDIVHNGYSGACGKLTADIKLDSSQPWTPIGKAWNSPFEGTFDGDGHTVSGLNVSGVEYAGLFGFNYGGIIQNVGIVDSTIGIDCNEAGGVCGYNFNGTIQNCYNTGEVSGGTKTGGVCGSNGGTIQNCYNTGAVSGSGNAPYAGGVCGYNYSYGTIQNCYNTGEVSGSGEDSCVGGVCGYSDGGTADCYYLDNITAGVGYNYNGTDDTHSRTLAQMTGSAAIGNMAGFDFTDTWATKDTETSITNGDTTATTTTTSYYPYLKVFGEGSAVSASQTSVETMKTEKINDKDFYLIYTAEQLATYRNIVNGTLTAEETAAGYTASSSACGKLMADIKLDSSQPWTPIGKAWNSPFEGTFDGDGHTVSGLNVSGVGYAGLFGLNIDGGTIQNVGIIDSTISGTSSAGGVCGYNFNGTIQNCYNTGAVSGSGNVGGVCGYNAGGKIQNCYNIGEVNVSGDYTNAGGVCGYNYEGTIQNCYNTGEVNGSGYNPYVGGVCGYNYEGTIQNCYNTGEVNGSGYNPYVGGVCGDNSGSSAEVKNCYYLDNITAGVGYNYNGTDDTHSRTLAQIEDPKNLLAMLTEKDTTGAWNDKLSAVGEWEYGKPAVQPVLYFQNPISNNPTYTVTIPAAAEIGGEADITVQAGGLLATQSVEIGFAEGNDFTLVYSEDTSVTYGYEVSYGGTVMTSGGSLTSENTNGVQTFTLSFALKEGEVPKYAGKYEDTVTFTVGLKPA